MKLSTVSTFKTLRNSNEELLQIEDEELKRLQETLLEIIKDVDRVCKKYNLVYNLGGGSCLGAVRHNGFIPWDDDMDIDMVRRDYEKFREVFQEELGSKYWLHTPEDTKDYGLAFCRIRKRGTIFRSREDFRNTDEAGVYIDIFIIENTYNSRVLRKVHGFLSLSAGFMLSCRNFYNNKEFYMEMVKNNTKAKRVFRIKTCIGFLLSWISVDSLTHFWNNINKMCKCNDSKYVVVPVGRNHFFGELYERKKFCETIKFKFEDYELPICVDYDAYLKHMYGDYMKIPKKEDQEKHIFLEFKI